MLPTTLNIGASIAGLWAAFLALSIVLDTVRYYRRGL